MGHRQEDVERSSCQSGNSGRSSFLSLCLLAGSVRACEDEIQSSSFHSLLFSPVCISITAAQTIIFLYSTLTPSLPFPSLITSGLLSSSSHPLNIPKKNTNLSISLCRPKATVFWLKIVWILSTFQCVITSRIIGKRVSSSSHGHMRSVADRFGVASGHRWKEWKVAMNR